MAYLYVRVCVVSRNDSRGRPFFFPLTEVGLFRRKVAENVAHMLAHVGWQRVTFDEQYCLDASLVLAHKGQKFIRDIRLIRG
jgi:hypothetical protein